MKNNLVIYDHSWCEIVFENRNKTYGAYKLREQDGKSTILSGMGAVALLLAVLFLPILLSSNKVADDPYNDLYTADTIRICTLPIQKPTAIKPVSIKSHTGSSKRATTAGLNYNKIVASNHADIQDIVSFIPDAESGVGESTILDGLFKGPIGYKGQGTGESNGLEGSNDFTFAPEIFPTFPGGEDAMVRFIQKNLRFPLAAKGSTNESYVLLSFIINYKGEVTKIEIVQSGGPHFDQEAIKMAEKMPRWNPGKQNGKAVNVKYSLPLRFSLI